MGQETSFWEDIVPRVDPERCRRCRDCAPVAVCLARAFHRNGEDGVPVVDEDFCFGCYSCAGACLHKAIILPTKP